MGVRSKVLEGYVIIVVTGWITGETTRELGKLLRTTIRSGRYRIVVNVTSAAYLSEAGLRSLIQARRACEQDYRGTFRIVVPNEHPLRRVLAYTNERNGFATYPTEAAAVSI